MERALAIPITTLILENLIIIMAMKTAECFLLLMDYGKVNHATIKEAMFVKGL